MISEVLHSQMDVQVECLETGKHLLAFNVVLDEYNEIEKLQQKFDLNFHAVVA